MNISQFCGYSISFSIKFWCMAFLGTAIVSNTRKFSSSKVSCYTVLGFAVRVPIASYPGPFEKSEKRAWYPLFAHALNFPTFREFRIIL